MGTRLRRHAPAIAAAAALLLGGCRDGEAKGDEGPAEPSPESNGIAEMAPPEALRTAIEAHRDAEGVVYEGRVQEAFPVGLRTFDVRIVVTPDACETTLTGGELGTLATRVLDGKRYTRGSRDALGELFELPASAVDLLAGRWLQEELAGEFECQPVERYAGIVQISECELGESLEVEDVPTLGVRCRGSNGVYYRFAIATTGPPLVLQIEQMALSGDLLTLVETDPGARISAPPARDVIDTEAFG